MASTDQALMGRAAAGTRFLHPRLLILAASTCTQRSFQTRLIKKYGLLYEPPQRYVCALVCVRRYSLPSDRGIQRPGATMSVSTRRIAARPTRTVARSTRTRTRRPLGVLACLDAAQSGGALRAPRDDSPAPLKSVSTRTCWSAYWTSPSAKPFLATPWWQPLRSRSSNFWILPSFCHFGCEPVPWLPPGNLQELFPPHETCTVLPSPLN